jgi:predicted nucleotide-binding protein
VEIPSDYSGVLFIPYDAAGLWQYQVAKEMKAAGVKIDLNRI